MNRISLGRDLVPVNELRANLASVLKKVEETRHPVVITQRGRAAAVLLHPDELDELAEQRELVQKVLRGLSESEAGELVDDDDVWSEIEQQIAEVEAEREGAMDSRSAS